MKKISPKTRVLILLFILLLVFLLNLLLFKKEDKPVDKPIEEPKDKPVGMTFPPNQSMRDNMIMLEDSVVSYINQYRKEKGLAPLQMDDNISAEAVVHSEGMAQAKIPFGHDGFVERSTRIIKHISLFRGAAENVASGILSPKQVVENWIDSPEHRKNIEGKYNLTGIGIERREDGTLFFTQIFINGKPVK